VSRIDLGRHAPLILIAVLVIAPLAIWAATSGGSGDEDGLIVERSVSVTGAPELVISIVGDAQVTSGATTVRVDCRDAAGKVTVRSEHPWPFPPEPGFEYSHTHQGGDADEIEQTRRCRVLGTNKELEAEVK
jgi:hypothetical protein